MPIGKFCVTCGHPKTHHKSNKRKDGKLHYHGCRISWCKCVQYVEPETVPVAVGTKIVMTESAYIIATDLARVLGAKDLLRKITPANSADYISAKDYQMVMAILSSWSDKMFKRIKTRES